MKAQKYLPLVFAFSTFLLHLLIYNNLEFHRDELLYLALGRHASLGHASVPPLIGWISAILVFVFKGSLLSVKFIAALFGAGITILCCEIAKKLGGGRYAILLAGSAMVLSPVMLRVFHLYQPVVIDMFFWTALIYFSILYHQERKVKDLYWMGFFLGLGMLNKYLIALLAAGLICSFLLHKRWIFTRKELYQAFGISLLILLPNLLWQVFNRFPVITHMNALNAQQLVNVNRISFLGDQLLMSLGFSILIVGALFHFVQKKYTYLLTTSIFVYLVLLVLRGKSYYTIGLFPMFFAFGSVFWENLLSKISWRVLFYILIVPSSILSIPIGLPIFKENGLVQYFKYLEDQYGLVIGRTFEDGTIHPLPQDYADQLGWEELAQSVREVYAKVKDKEKSLIYCENYGQASALVAKMNAYDLPHPVSFSDNYKFWNPTRFEPDIETFLYINDELGEDVAAFFSDIDVVPAITNEYAREAGLNIYVCREPRGSFNALWKEVHYKYGFDFIYERGDD